MHVMGISEITSTLMLMARRTLVAVHDTGGNAGRGPDGGHIRYAKEVGHGLTNPIPTTVFRITAIAVDISTTMVRPAQPECVCPVLHILCLARTAPDSVDQNADSVSSRRTFAVIILAASRSVSPLACDAQAR